MIELLAGPLAIRGLQWLEQQTVFLCAALLLMTLLRPMLMRAAGPRGVHAAWLAVPLGQLALQLPRPTVLPPLQVLALIPQLGPQPGTAGEMAAAPQAWEPGAVLLMWLAGVVLLLAMQWHAQGRMLTRLVRGPLVWRSPAGCSPALVGLWRPRLVLPADFRRRFTGPERALVLAHEAAHARRGDNAWTLLARLMVCLHWFNPLAWWALRRFAQDQELACDAVVLQHAPARDLALYAHALLKTGCAPSSTALWPPLAASWQSSHPLQRRVQMLKNHRTHVAHAGRIRLGAVVAAALLSLLGYALQGQAQAQSTGAPVDLRLTVRDGETLLGEPRVITREGQPATVAFQPAGADSGTAWRIELTPQALPDASYRLDLVLYQGEAAEAVARPRLVVKAGQPGRVEIGEAGRTLKIDLLARPAPEKSPEPARQARGLRESLPM